MPPIIIHICGLPCSLEVVDDGKTARLRWECPLHGPVEKVEELRLGW